MATASEEIRRRRANQRKAASQQRLNYNASLKRTPRAEDRALAVLAEGRSIASAALAAGVNRFTLMRWRRETVAARPEGFDPDVDEDFATRWDDAVEHGVDLLEDEALRRAKDGVQKPVFGSLGANQGTGVVGHIQEYSDTLMTLSLKGRRPERYKDRTELSGDKNNPVHHTFEVEFVEGKK